MTSSNGDRPGVIYTRLSKVKRRDKEAGQDDIQVADQEAKLRTLAGLNSVTVAAVFTDNDLTAYKASGRYKGRPGFDDMLKRLAAGDVGVIFVCQMFRLYRSHSDMERLVNLCRKHTISVKTVEGGDMDLTTATGKMVAGILAEVGEQEVALLTERTRDGKERIRAAGRWPGGIAPFGYRVEGEFPKGTGKVVIVEDEAAEIRHAVGLVLNGMPLREVCAALNARRDADPDRTGRAAGRWHRGHLGDTLTRAAYAGLVSLGGEIVGDGDWPAIITVSQLTAVRALVAADNAVNRHGRSPRQLLSGVAWCGKCGGQRIMCRSPYRRNPGDRWRYTCKDCYGVTRVGEKTDEMALDAVREILSTPSALALAARPGPDVAALTARREQIHAELEEWAAMHLTPREHKIATAPLRDELDRVERQLADAYRGTVLEDIARAPDPAAKFDALPTIAQKREVLRKLIKVTLLPVKGSPGAMKGTGEDWKVGERWFNRESVQIEFLGALREQPR